MAGNSNLHMSRNDKADEFYTQLSLIESELKHYRQHFRVKRFFATAMTHTKAIFQIFCYELQCFGFEETDNNLLCHIARNGQGISVLYG